jgi:hypothetical protein
VDRPVHRFKENELNLKTQEQLRRWWFQRPFFFEHGASSVFLS